VLQRRGNSHNTHAFTSDYKNKSWNSTMGITILHRQNRVTCQDLVSSALLSLANMQMTTCIVYVYVPCQLTIIIVGLNIFVLTPTTSVGGPRSAWISRSCHVFFVGCVLTTCDNKAIKFFLHDDRFQHRVGAKSGASQANDGQLLNEST